MELLIIFIIGLAVSFFGSFTSGTVSMLSLTALMMTGLNPLVALGIHRFGLFGLDLGGLVEYTKNKQVVWKMVPILSGLGVLAAIVGSHIILQFDPEVLKKLIGIIAISFIPILLLRPKLGLVEYAVTSVRKKWGYVAYFLTTVWGSSFNIGVGIFILYTHLHFFGQTIIQTKATSKIPGLFKNITVLIVFFGAGFLDFQSGLVYLLGMFIGSTLATKVIVKIGNEWLRNILLVTIGLFSIKLILGL